MSDLDNNAQFSQEPQVTPVDSLDWLQIPEPTAQPETPAGIDPAQYQAFLSFQQQQQQAPQVPQVTEQQAPDEEYEAFNSQLTSYLGVGVGELKEVMGFISEMRREKQLSPLRQEWGDSFDERYEAAKGLYQRLPETQKAMFNSVDGLRMLAAKATSMAQNNVPGGAIPTFDRGRSAVPGSGNKYAFTQSEILAMDSKTYAARSGEIAAAYSTGRVNLQS